MNMKNIINVTLVMVILSTVGCVTDRGELVGVPGRRPWFHPQPFGTVYIPTGTFHSGQSDEDIFHTYIAPNKQISVVGFWMDDTEITNNEYRQFVYYVRDSIARKMLDYVIEDENENEILDYSQKVDFKASKEDLEDMYYRESQRYRKQRQMDITKLIFEYEWIDLQKAAHSDYWNASLRSSHIRKEKTKIYPDTLVWVRDFTYSYNEPMARQYFYHPKYDDYPVVGVTWKQANAFGYWRTFWQNKYWESIEEPVTEHWRLPSEFEWEYAARGNRDNNMYPWGGPYTRNSKGCLMANFKPNRGDYINDGGFYPVRADSYFPNDYGLYNMAGNVAEWTSSAYDESSLFFTSDMNADYKYDAQDSDPESLKRKVTRGGSWKDVAYFLQNGSRAYEYQDTTKSSIGFRCVQNYVGRSPKDRR